MSPTSVACPAQRGCVHRIPVRRCWVEHLRQTKVEHFDRAVLAHSDVRGFQISMNDPLLVRRFERLGDLPRDRQARRPAESGRARSAAPDPRLPRVPSPAHARRRTLQHRRWRRCADDSVRPAAAPRARTGRAAPGSDSEVRRQNLDGHVCARASDRARGRPRPSRRRQAGCRFDTGRATYPGRRGAPDMDNRRVAKWAGLVMRGDQRFDLAPQRLIGAAGVVQESVADARDRAPARHGRSR